MAVTIIAQGLEVDAEVLTVAFKLEPSTLQEKMRAGDVTSLSEKGVRPDAGRFV